MYKRQLYALCLGLLGFSFAMALYPAWQVPFVYVYAVLIVWTVIKNWSRGCFGLKDAGPVCLALLILGGGMLYFLRNSAEGMALVGQTVYPGARFENGGGILLGLFQYATSVFYPFTSHGIVGNVCEPVSYTHLAGRYRSLRRSAVLDVARCACLEFPGAGCMKDAKRP